MRELVARVLHKIYARYIMPVPDCRSTSLSDNQGYPQVCLKASSDYWLFNEFRRNPVYNAILEHLSESQGHEYLHYIERDPDVMGAIAEFKRNDAYGNPRCYEYPAIGRISPTTLRYIKVLVDLKKHFHSLDSMNLCEIGVGYGGQCRIINAYYKPATYCLIDIQPALALAQRFLDNYALHSILAYRTMNELAPREYDLVLSNYAFSELSRTAQDVYLRKVVLNSKRGYLTYNEIAPPEFASYKASEVQQMIPGSRLLKEEPPTHRHPERENSILVWGDQG
jgi:hypothetical protein